MFSQKYSQIRFFTFIMTLAVVGAIYKEPPVYFSSFYCNLGTKTMADSGDYTCTSPRVIERADKFSLALVEFNKRPSANIWFEAAVTSSPGVSLTSVGIRLEFKTTYITKYGYMVLVIGYQPQNNWLDVINVKLPVDTVQNKVLVSTGNVFNYKEYDISLSSTLGNADNIRIFITSFGAEPISPATQVYLNLYYLYKVSSVVVPKTGSSSVNCGTQTTLFDHAGEFVNYEPYANGYTVLNNDGSGVIELKGSIDTEAGYDFIRIYSGSGTTGTLLQSLSGTKTFGPVISSPGQTLTVRFHTDYAIQGQGLKIEVKYSGVCLTSPPAINYHTCGANPRCLTIRSDILIPQTLRTLSYGVLAWKSASKPSTAFLALKTNFDLKVDSVNTLKKQDFYAGNQKFGPSFNTKCLVMLSFSNYKADFTFELFNSTLSNSYQAQLSSTGSAQNIFDFFCLADTAAATALGEFDYVDPKNGLFYSLGSECPVPTTPFVQTQNTCDKCVPTDCIDCEIAVRTQCVLCQPGFGITSTGSCATCTSLFTNCITCSSDTNKRCTQCVAGYGISATGTCATCLTSFTYCVTCSNVLPRECTSCDPGYIVSSGSCSSCGFFFPNCIMCISLAGGCTKCATRFGVTSSALCQTCSILFPYCLLCSRYDSVCTGCVTEYGINSLGQCEDCTTLYPNCHLCATYNTGCTSCLTTFGITSTGQCELCLTLYSNCNLCVAYNTGCTQCMPHYGITSTGFCDTCLTLYSQCDLCVSQTSGCSKCLTGYVLGPTAQCALCSSYYPNCDTCNTYNGGCTLCVATYGVTSVGQCRICTSFYSNCVQCIKYNGGCTLCTTGFGVASSGQCAVCSSLYSNCLSCVSYNSGCTSCKTGFGFDVLGQCTACSILYPNCLLCNSYNSGCSSCSAGYGISATAQCSLCSTLYLNCAKCTSHDTGCTQCNAISNAYLLSSKECMTCAEISLGCISCQPNGANSGLICTQCARGYYLDSSQNGCFPCPEAILDCEQCYFNTTTSKVRCTLCTDQYLVDERFLCEKCKVNIYYQRMCYYLPGCSSLAVINGTLICLACTLPNFQFSIKIKKCTCQKGFNFSTVNDTCNSICGDGIKTPTEGCDDGNMVNGDGCSDLCKIEKNYKCEQNNNTKSVCIFTHDIKLTLDYILKVQGQNKAEIYFKVEPAPSSLTVIDWQKTISFHFMDFSKNPVVSFSYENGVLIASLVYFEDMEEKTCEMNVKFDSLIILSKSQYLYFPVKGSSGKLIFQSQSVGENQKTVGLLSFALGISALVCFAISNYFHKLIGLETIQFIQLIYFSRIVFSGDFKSNALAFNSLKYSNGYNEIDLSGAKPNASAAEIPPIFSQIQLQMYYLDNCNTMIIPIILATLAYALYFLRRARANSVYRETKQISIRDNIVDMGRKITWIYENFIFPYTLSLLYLTLFQMIVYELSNLLDQSEVSTLYVQASFSLSLLILVYTFSIFCVETVYGFKDYLESLSNKASLNNEDKTLTDERHKDQHPLYVPFYLLYQLCLIFLVNTALLEFTYLAEFMAGLILLYSVVFFCWKPYDLNIHNYANIYNQIVLMLFLGMSILGQKMAFSDTMKILSLYGTLSLIVIALAIQMARVYVFSKSEKRKFTLDNQKKPKPSVLNVIKPSNPYLVNNKLTQLIKKEDRPEANMNGMVDTTILGRQKLRKLLLEHTIADDKKINLTKQKEPQQVDEKEQLRRLKERMRRGYKAYHQWSLK